MCRIRSLKDKSQKLDLLFTFSLLYRWWRQTLKETLEKLQFPRHDTNPVANDRKNEKQAGLRST